MPRFVSAAFVYFAIVFALGFVLGTIRVVLTAPAMGDVWATIVELPAMLAASWIACGWTIMRFRVPARAGARAGIGLLALLFLLSAETALGVVGFGRSVETQFAEYLKTGPLLGLIAQMVFAAMPLLRRDV
jgi:hypothetical protein